MKYFFILAAALTAALAFCLQGVDETHKPISLRFSGVKRDGAFKPYERAKTMHALSNSVVRLGRDQARFQIDVALHNDAGDIAVVSMSEQLGRKEFRAFANLEGDVVLFINDRPVDVTMGANGNYTPHVLPPLDFLTVEHISFVRRDGTNVITVLSTELPR